MALSYASNSMALAAQTRLSRTTDSLSRTFERLSSGLRINHASDDAAGLALADSLRADALATTAAIRNANDAISVTSITDSALAEIGNILYRMYELAEQSSNGVYTNTQRSALSQEFVSLGSEIERIAASTEFNDLPLISNSSAITIQVGIDSSANSRITIAAVQGTLNALGLAASGSGALTYSIISTTTGFSQTAAQNALAAIDAAIDSLGTKRGIVGAAESRLTHAINYLQVARENLAAAESRIRDADVAQEVADMTRLQVLQQAATAVLAQANLQPQVVYKLLQ